MWRCVQWATWRKGFFSLVPSYKDKLRITTILVGIAAHSYLKKPSDFVGYPLGKLVIPMGCYPPVSNYRRLLRITRWLRDYKHKAKPQQKILLVNSPCCPLHVPSYYI